MLQPLRLDVLLRLMDPRVRGRKPVGFPDLMRTMFPEAYSDLRLPRGQQQRWIYMGALGILALYVSVAKATDFGPSPVSLHRL